jgi:protein TonB
MFEDSTFESNGRIHTRSRGWMLATFAFNGSILLALILIPLFYPDALPQMFTSILMEAPPPPPPQQPKPMVRATRESAGRPEMQGSVIFAPTKFPDKPFIQDKKEEPSDFNIANLDFDSERTRGNSDVFGSSSRHTVVKQVTGPVSVPSKVVEGLLVHKTIPGYPRIAVASGTQGTVVLQATISRSGTIENLHVVGGPIMLQQAALDAVATWRYRPYLLNGEPVEVETTVNVIFKLQ